MRSRRILTGVLPICAAAAAAVFYWYFFVGTLMLSEILDKPDDPVIAIVVNIADFDTGLTRFDLLRLSRKSDYWQARINEVASIGNPQTRTTEQERLMNEMMDDPVLKKIARKVLTLHSTPLL